MGAANKLPAHKIAICALIAIVFVSWWPRSTNVLFTLMHVQYIGAAEPEPGMLLPTLEERAIEANFDALPPGAVIEWESRASRRHGLDPGNASTSSGL